MPKSAKKRKEKAADFSKAKLKLGKGKVQPTNAIDTSFKARSIALPSQSITIEKTSSGPVTKRQLTFNDLLSHLKHYNSGTRKDAILGLKELFEDNWELIDSSLPALLSSMVRLIGDEDASVRKQLLSFVSWLLPKINTNDLIPHSPLLLLYTTSAQSHIFPEIRIDAIRFLDVLLDCAPEVVLSGWATGSGSHGSRALEGYLGILNAGTKLGESNAGSVVATSTASVVLTPASKLVVLRSLSTFLRLGLLYLAEGSLSQREHSSCGTSQSMNTWFMSQAFSSPAAFKSFDDLLRPKDVSGTNYRTWQEVVDQEDEELCDQFPPRFTALQKDSDDPWTLDTLTNLQDLLSSDIHGPESNRPGFISNLTNTLHSTIIETYLDCAPSVFSPGANPLETELQLVLAVLRISTTLYRFIAQSEQLGDINKEHLESIVNYLSPYFPAQHDRDIRIQQDFEEFNLIFCELASLLVHAGDHSRLSRIANTTRFKGLKSSRSASSSTLTIQYQQIERVTQYIIGRLRSSSTSSVSTVISSTAYSSLLPTIWALINVTPDSVLVSGPRGIGRKEANELLHATLDHAIKVGSKSSCKRPTIEFVGRLILLETEPHYQSHFSFERDSEVKTKFHTWLLHLPQVLWEVGNALGGGGGNAHANNIACSEVILRTLLRVLQRRSKGLSQETLSALQARLTPYFHIDHPTRGALPGPYRNLPPISSNTSRTGAGLPTSEGSFNPNTATHPLRLLAFDMVVSLLQLTSYENDPVGPPDCSAAKLLRAVDLATEPQPVDAAPSGNVAPMDVKYWMDVRTSLLLSKG